MTLKCLTVTVKILKIQIFPQHVNIGIYRKMWSLLNHLKIEVISHLLDACTKMS